MKNKIFTLFCLIIIGRMSAQEKNLPQRVDTKITVSTAVSFKETQSINMLFSEKQVENIQQEIEREKAERSHRKPQVFKYSVADGPQYGNDPSTIQTTMGTRQSLGVLKKWTGLTGSSMPLDPNGTVGMTKYVETINSTPFAVYDKAGTGTPLYQGSVGTVTNSGSDGDPVVVYDKFADRWCITQMNGTTGVSFAVSKTNDPAGAWNAYQFTVTNTNDYLKFSVWSDGYYMTFNNGGNILIFERAAMIAGSATARSIAASFTTPTNAGNGFWLPMPGDADGIIPPAGLRCPLFGYTDNAWGGTEIDGVKIWSVGVTWGTTPTANVTLDATIPTAAFDASYDTAGPWNDITQPSSQKLDGIGGICMFRAQWNSFPTSNRVVLNWAVKISATQRSIKWVELRQDPTTKTWSLYQEGIYAPDASNRWLGSIAMDCSGNIALCYSIASSSISMALGYTGRLATDPVGTFPIAETVVFPGTGSISGSNRIGDYSSTSIDPVDGLTFWHTGGWASSGKRATGIFSFQLANNCATSVNEEVIQTEFTAYQSGNVINVKASGLPLDDKYLVQLYDISGKKISESKINSTSKSFETKIEVNGLSSGVYLVRIGTSDFQKVAKIVLQ